MTDRKWARDDKTPTLWLEMETEIVGCDISEVTRSGTLRGKRGHKATWPVVYSTVLYGKGNGYGTPCTDSHAHAHTQSRCIGSWHRRPKRPGSLVLSRGGAQPVFCMACMALHEREVEPAAEIPCARVASGWVWMRKWVWVCLLLSPALCLVCVGSIVRARVCV